MHAARKNGLLTFLLGILTRLYLLSGFVIVIVVMGNILGLLSSATYTYQALGAMIVTGVIWFLALSINAIVAERPGDQPDTAKLFRSSISATSSSTDPQSH